MAYDDDDFDGNGSDLVKQLRKQLRDQAKKLEELSEENGKLSKQVRTKSVEEILDAKKVDRRIAQFIPSEVTDPDAVGSWLEQNGDLFGIKKAEDQDEGGLPPEAQAAAQQIANAGGTADLASHQAQQMQALKNANTREELEQLVFGQQ